MELFTAHIRDSVITSGTGTKVKERKDGQKDRLTRTGVLLPNKMSVSKTMTTTINKLL